jgi:hypothetical protein
LPAAREPDVVGPDGIVQPAHDAAVISKAQTSCFIALHI